VPLLTKASNVPDHLQLLLARREAPLLVGNEPKGHLACSIPSGPLGLKGRSGPGANQGALVSGGCVDHGLHELVGGPDTVASAVSGDDARALPTYGALDDDSDVNVTREPVAASHEEKARTVLAKITERVEEPRPVLEFAPAADSLVRVPGYDRDVFALGPLLDGRALSLGAKALVLGTDAQIGDGDLGAARTSGTHD